MPGWVVVSPIPASREEQDQTVGGWLMSVRQMGVMAGVVMEANPGAEETEFVPYGDGCTILYFDEGALKIGGYHYVRVNGVLAWEEAPE
jgi:hypothetical protein